MSAEGSHPIHHAANSLAQVEDLVEHLHNLREIERIAMARRLHDQLGGLLVSAVMDLGWAEQHLASTDTLRERLRRVRTSLGSAINLERDMTERLRPTLLDNLGLFAACRWQFKNVCAGRVVARTETYPDNELVATEQATTGLFRIMQDLLEMTSREADVAAIDLSVHATDSDLTMWLHHEHSDKETVSLEQTFASELASVSHRVSSLQGKFTVTHFERGARFVVTFPLHDILIAQ